MHIPFAYPCDGNANIDAASNRHVDEHTYQHGDAHATPTASPTATATPTNTAKQAPWRLYLPIFLHSESGKPPRLNASSDIEPGRRIASVAFHREVCHVKPISFSRNLRQSARSKTSAPGTRSRLPGFGGDRQSCRTYRGRFWLAFALGGHSTP